MIFLMMKTGRWIITIIFDRNGVYVKDRGILRILPVMPELTIQSIVQSA